MQIVARSPETHNPMLNISKSYRIARTDQAGWYWTGSIWGNKVDARLYNERERNTEQLPERGCWEIDAAPVTPVRRSLDRSVVSQAIAQMLLSQYCREEGVQLRRLNELSASESKRFFDAADFITNWTLSPERAQTAVMALADTFCGEEISIFDVSPRTRKHYYDLAVAGIDALQDNVKEVPSDWHYRDKLCRLLDGMLPAPEPKPEMCWSCSQYPAPRPGAQCAQCWKENQ